MFALRCINKTVPVPLKMQCRKASVFRRCIGFFFKKNLLFTNSITSGAFMVIGDLVQQEFEYKSKYLEKRYDWGRAWRMFIVGTAMGPLHHYYYLHLDNYLPKTNMKTVFVKVLCDQLFASPATIICFFLGMGFLEKKTLQECTEEIKHKFKYVYAVDWLYWPPVQIINFYYLPTQYRVVYINIATMIFNVFMSYIKHYDQHGPIVKSTNE